MENAPMLSFARTMCRWLAVTPLFAGCELPPQSEEKPPPNVIFYGVRMQYFRGGELAASGRAAEATYERASAEVVAQNAQLFLVRSGRSPVGRSASGGMDIRAQLAQGFLLHRQLELSGGVVVDSPTAQGTTERASFDGLQMRISGDRPASVKGPGYQLSGDRFSFDLREEQYTFFGGVSGWIGAMR